MKNKVSIYAAILAMVVLLGTLTYKMDIQWENTEGSGYNLRVWFFDWNVGLGYFNQITEYHGDSSWTWQTSFWVVRKVGQGASGNQFAQIVGGPLSTFVSTTKPPKSSYTGTFIHLELLKSYVERESW